MLGECSGWRYLSLLGLPLLSWGCSTDATDDGGSGGTVTTAGGSSGAGGAPTSLSGKAGEISIPTTATGGFGLATSNAGAGATADTHGDASRNSNGGVAGVGVQLGGVETVGVAGEVGSDLGSVAGGANSGGAASIGPTHSETGTAIAGTGASGTGASGTGAGGTGASGTGAGGTGASGTGAEISSTSSLAGAAGSAGAGGSLGVPCDALTLAATPTTPRHVGVQVDLTATATCPIGVTAEYRFLTRQSGQATVELRAWGTARASWQTSLLGPAEYELIAEVRQPSRGTAAETTSSLVYALLPACSEGYQLDGQGNCSDIDECAKDNGGCDKLTNCTNSIGSRTCGVCPSGYEGTGAKGCTDIDECKTDNGGCYESTSCTNTIGGCICGACPSGYSGNGDGICPDINECLTKNGGCYPGTTCTNIDGGRTCGPCPSGYSGNGDGNCPDINECLTNNGDCDPLTTCTNTLGGRLCGNCPAGYTGSGAAGCVDIDECATNHGGCDALVACTNISGSRTCGACPEGYKGTGDTKCVPIVKCSSNPCQNGGTCTDTDDGHSCVCLDGFGGNDCDGLQLVAVGDIADCLTAGASAAGRTATAALLDEITGPVLTLGDANNTTGKLDEYLSCFDTAWGRHKSRIHPTPGNHDYMTKSADGHPQGYIDYFTPAVVEPNGALWYSFDLGAWHIISLNANCAEATVGCTAGGQQETWLRQDLEEHKGSPCTIAFFHEPRFSSGQHGNGTAAQPLWQALADYQVEMVLSGHDHDYERFAAMDGSGKAVTNGQGIVQFVVGTGGAPLRTVGSVAANSKVRITQNYGVLKLALREGSYDWEFVPIAGATGSDKGTAFCY